MPLNKNQLERFKYIDSVLASEHGATTKEIAAHFASDGITLRTIQKDLVMLRDEFGHKMHVVGGRYHYDDKVNTMFNHGLSPDERHLLLELMGVMGGIGDMFPNLQSLEQRLGAEERRAGGRENNGTRNILLFHTNPEYEGNRLISTLFNYIYDKRLVVVSYRKFSSSRIQKYVISPYLLKEYDSRWYLVGKCMAILSQKDKQYKDPILSLPLDRIVELSPDVAGGYKFEPEPADLRDRFDYIIGATYYQGNPDMDIIVAVRNSDIQGYVRTKPLCGSQDELKGQKLDEARKKWPEFDDCAFFMLKNMKMNPEMVQALVKYYGEMVVLSPDSVRQEIHEKTRKLMALYDTLG